MCSFCLKCFLVVAIWLGLTGNAALTPGAETRGEHVSAPEAQGSTDLLPEDGEVRARDGGSSSRELFLSLLTLIGDFTKAMDRVERDREIYDSTVSRFTSLLTEYNRRLEEEEEGEDGRGSVGELLERALLGAFELRVNTVKDRLWSGKFLSVNTSEFDMEDWTLTLVHGILDSGNVTDLQSALILAVRLQLKEAVELLLRIGTSAYPAFLSTSCNDALYHAVVNQNMELATILINAYLSEVNLESDLCTFLTVNGCHTPSSPWEVATVHCHMRLSCDVIEYFGSLVTAHCAHIGLPADKSSLMSHVKSRLSHDVCQCVCRECTEVCFTYESDLSFSEVPSYCNWLQGRFLSVGNGGWGVYSGFHLGREGCDLPRVRADELTNDEFQFFINMSIPVLIEGAMEKWSLFSEWRKYQLSREYGHFDVLAGPIPYGEVFGERFGYATISEFLTYMDGYSKDPTIDYLRDGSFEKGDSDSFRAPLYVFDNEFLINHFNDSYKLPEIFSLWHNVSQHHQFILGPAGSGSPFHFHCQAANALVHGRKKWFLRSPGNAVYSKKHPLLWYWRDYETEHRRPLECLQKGGEIIFVPSRWSHAVINVDENIGLAVEFDTGDC